MFSIIIPARGEGAGLYHSVARLAKDSAGLAGAEVIVVLNGPEAVADAAGLRPLADKGQIRLLYSPDPGKSAALNTGDRAARWPARVYLDADVRADAALWPALAKVLARPNPVYASGTPRLIATGLTARHYARFWARLPFMQDSPQGFGLYAVNGAGRARWGMFSPNLADDIQARACFAPSERVALPQGYDWPLARGLIGLIRTRARQDRQAFRDNLARQWDLACPVHRNDGAIKGQDDPFLQCPTHPVPHSPWTAALRPALRDPVGAAVYGLVRLGAAAARLRPALRDGVPDSWGPMR